MVGRTEFPERIEDIFDHFQSCRCPNPDSKREGCLMCSNIIASAIIYYLEAKDKSIYFPSKEIISYRILKTLSSMYNPCERALPYQKLSDLSGYLHEQSKKTLLIILENHLFTNAEFKPIRTAKEGK
jgi:hypothetical protein